MTNKPNAEELLDKYRKGICTEQEKAIVESWHLHVLSGKTFKPTAKELKQADKELRRRLLLPNTGAKTRIFRLYLSAAAMLLIVAAAGYLFLVKGKQTQAKKQPVLVARIGGVAEPKRAVLTLSNGSSIVLDHARPGLLARQGSAAIQQNTSGELIYNNQVVQSQPETAVLQNTIATQKGAGYNLTLSDGTKVWLNSASSLSFPAVFTGNDRKVQLTGEAYFEVAKNKEKPFIVEANGTQIQVLGTHFNVGAYTDEQAVITTLLEGSVRVAKNDKQLIISPGQQAISWLNNNGIKLANADIDEAMAWKNGYFKFRNENIRSIFRKVSHWYDIEVEYRGKVDVQRFGGTYSRSKNIGELLAHLEKIGNIHFKVEGRRIIVMA